MFKLIKVKGCVAKTALAVFIKNLKCYLMNYKLVFRVKLLRIFNFQCCKICDFNILPIYYMCTLLLFTCIIVKICSTYSDDGTHKNLLLQNGYSLHFMCWIKARYMQVRAVNHITYNINEKNIHKQENKTHTQIQAHLKLARKLITYPFCNNVAPKDAACAHRSIQIPKSSPCLW